MKKLPLAAFICAAAAFLPLSSGCTGKTAEPADGGQQCTVEGLPQFTTACTSCHNVQALGDGPSDETAGVKEWMSARGTGLIQVDPAFPAAGLMLNAPWKQRGHHDGPELMEAACSSCHPTRSDGMGHGTRTYPQSYRDKPFVGGWNCAGACHVWLKNPATSKGFENSEGKTPVYKGSVRPDALLTAVATAHQKLWMKGHRSDSTAIRIAALNPGCGACHHPQDESHGSVPSCLTCHSFGGSEGALHLDHQRLATEHMDEIDPKRPQMTGCAYCHYETDAAAVRSNAVCYNCHLSGHQPLDAEGRAHFWPILE